MPLNRMRRWILSWLRFGAITAPTWLGVADAPSARAERAGAAQGQKTKGYEQREKRCGESYASRGRPHGVAR